MKCVDCKTLIKNGHLCNECFTNRLDDKVRQDALDVDIEHPSNRYF